MSKSMNILIAGAGIAGPALGLLLTRVGHKCTIVERADDFRSSGQQIDISGEALQVIKIMGLYDEIKAHTVNDDGMKFVTADNEVLAAFPASDAGGLVKEIEIMRPHLAHIFYEPTRDKVEYIFGDQVGDLHQHGDGVTVSFASSGKAMEFDLVVAADGLRSKTRELAFGPENTKIISLNQYAGYFDIPWQEQDGTWSRWYNASGGRCVCLRPNQKNGTTSAYLCQVTDKSGEIGTLPLNEQTQEIVEVFKDAGWETGRVLEKLQSDNAARFYAQESAQSKSASWVKGRVVLVGDAGYSPSPLSGQGTSISLIGAYILAGCISTYLDYQEALERYQKLMKPFVDSAQKLPPGVPWIVNPQSTTGIRVLNNVLWIAGKAMNLGIGTALGKLGAPVSGLFGSNELKLPDFPILEAAM